MLPDPLHPAVVHFPIVLAVLLPVAALVALVAVRRGAEPLRAWAVPVVLAVALTGSAWVALETGEAEEEKVEAVVSEAALHEHEEAAERFLVLSGITTVVALGGLLAGTLGTAARVVATVGTVAVVAAGVQVGAAGGELVYVHGAAQPYITEAAAAGGSGGATMDAARETERSDDDSDDEAH